MMDCGFILAWCLIVLGRSFLSTALWLLWTNISSVFHFLLVAYIRPT